MQTYKSHTKILFYALQDLLVTIINQPNGVVIVDPSGIEYIKTPEYKNAVETYAHYLEKLSETDDTIRESYPELSLYIQEHLKSLEIHHSFLAA